MTHTLRILILLVSASLLSPLPALCGESLPERVDRFRTELEALVDNVDPTSPRPDRDRIEHLYLDYFASKPFHEEFENLTLDVLVALHTATEAAFFYTLSPMLLDRLGCVLTQIVDRFRQADTAGSSVERRYLESFHANLLRARRFSQAREFAERHALDASPWYVIDETPTGAGPTVLEISPDRTSITLARTTVSLGPGPKVVAVVDPLCGPSAGAMNQIEGDQGLVSLFSGRTLWLADARRSVPIEPLIDWNTKAREIKIAISYDNHAWPTEIDFSTPVFYFFRDGVVRDKVIGWPGPERVARIHAAFEAIGVNPMIDQAPR